MPGPTKAGTQRGPESQRQTSIERVSLLERRLTEVHNEREDLREKKEDLVKQIAHERHVRNEQSIEAKKATAILQEEIDTAKEEMVSLHNQMLALTEAKNKVEEKLGRKKDQILALESEAKSALENSRMQKRLESENSALRSSIKQCDESMEAMRKEVFELNQRPMRPWHDWRPRRSHRRSV